MNARYKREPDRKVIERISIKDDGVFVAWYLEAAGDMKQEPKTSEWRDRMNCLKLIRVEDSSNWIPECSTT